MSVESRVRKLERETDAGGCPLCHGEGPKAQVLVWERGCEKPVHPSCPHCGAVPGVVKLIIMEGADAP